MWLIEFDLCSLWFSEGKKTKNAAEENKMPFWCWHHAQQKKVKWAQNNFPISVRRTLKKKIPQIRCEIEKATLSTLNSWKTFHLSAKYCAWKLSFLLVSFPCFALQYYYLQLLNWNSLSLELNSLFLVPVNRYFVNAN